MIVTIDDIKTRDMDDAISIEQYCNQLTLTVYIADVSKLTPEMYELASERMETDYVNKIPMLPKYYSEYAYSLIVGQVRPVISATFKYKYDHGWHKDGDCVFARTEIIVDKRMTYAQADFNEIISGMSIIHQIWQNGNVLPCYSSPSYELRGSSVVLLPNDEYSRKCLASIMQMTNVAAAKQIMKYGPAITVSRTEKSDQRQFKEFVEAGGYIADLNYSKVYKNISGNMYMPTLLSDPRNNKADYAIDAINCMVGDYYVQFTSPIRRFADVIAHRQLIASLNGERAYTDNELEELLCKFNSYARKRDYSLANRYKKENVFWATPITKTKVYIMAINLIADYSYNGKRRYVLLRYDGKWKHAH
jgi:exoribonuclease R